MDVVLDFKVILKQASAWRKPFIIDVYELCSVLKDCIIQLLPFSNASSMCPGRKTGENATPHGALTPQSIERGTRGHTEAQHLHRYRPPGQTF